jgi:lipopolysaccharide/colanic/teichoic acid biosynthesis glycosyltransferase
MYSILKRTLDLVVALLCLLVLFPVLAAISVLVRLRLGTPVLFHQERAGFQGRPFRIFKFRTMTSAQDAEGRLLSDKDRLPPFGQFLRASSLDELPQFFNILRGDMSLVGPRPLHIHYIPRYSDDQKRRLLVPPGITGWAQVNGRNSVSWEERFALDTWYVDHKNMTLDLRILVLTALKVLLREGISAKGCATMTEFKGDQRNNTRV